MTATPTTTRGRDVLLWTAWAAVVAGTTGFGAWALHVLVDAPHRMDAWWAIGAAAFAVPLVAVAVRPLRHAAATVLRITVTAAGLTAMVLAVYVVVVVGLGDDVDGSEHRVLGMSMVAGAVAVALAGPVRSRLRDATGSVGGRSMPSVAALETFGARMTRAVPMDELLLQLAETLHDTLAPLGAEVWTGENGALDRTVSAPDRGPGGIALAGPELAAVTGARVSGTSWVTMWLPGLLDGAADDRHTRVAPITHLGHLLGLVVVRRPAESGAFRPEEDALLADLARQLGLALHNVQLDSALQESLDELRSKNRLLQESQARIVTAADDSRRTIERDLHDGAQQRLVALALHVQIAKMKSGDPEALERLLDELGTEIQETIDEVRELAHGIYPPLLRDAGLAKALGRAADRAALRTTVDIAVTERYPPEIEGAVYFCCLEAMQNAAKHAGDDARVEIRVFEEAGHLVFEVADDGPGFDLATVSESAGLVNMRDRVGAFGGELTIASRPGEGATVRGTVPLVRD